MGFRVHSIYRPLFKDMRISKWDGFNLSLEHERSKITEG